MGGPENPVALEAVGLQKGFARDGRILPVLDLARLEVREGEFVTMVGPSGCGKSTLLHILGGFIEADAGQIRVHGRDVTGPGPDRGMMFQEFALFPWRTVAGNVAWSLEVQGRSRAEAARTACAWLRQDLSRAELFNSPMIAAGISENCGQAAGEGA